MAQSPEGAMQQKPIVLLVEDDRAIGTLVSKRLGDRYQVLVAGTDREACNFLRLNGRKLQALMDLQLIGSHLDGVDLIRLIRGCLELDKTPGYARGLARLEVPIFIASAAPERVSEAERRELGLDGAIPKPIDFRFLSLCLAQASIRQVVTGLQPASAARSAAR